MARPSNPRPPKPVEVPDPLAEFRDQDTQPPVVKPGATGATLPPTDDGGPVEYLYATESLPEAIALALMLASAEDRSVELNEALARELLVRVGPGVPNVLPLVSENEQDEIRAQMIATWHADTVALPILHKGGTCACRYIANTVLPVVLPARHAEELVDLRDTTED